MRPALPEPIGATLNQQLKLLEAAPSLSTALQGKKARVLASLDRFEEALRVCEAAAPLAGDPWHELLHAQLLLADTPGRDRDRGEKVLSDLLGRDLSKSLRARTLASLAQVALDRDDQPAARELILAALAIDPVMPDALRRYALIEARAGNLDALLSYTSDRLAEGVVSPLLTAIHATALAGCERADEARDIRLLDELFWSGTLPTPEGFADIEGFNRALAEELLHHPAKRYENSRRASRASWRVDELLVTGSEHVPTLLETIASAVENYVGQVVDAPERGRRSLFDAYRPKRCRIASWAVMPDADGFETWHVHGRGWISGVFYVTVPEELQGTDPKAGAIDFGWWEDVLGENSSERFGQRRVHPEPGMLLLFPSHIHHRTWPHGTNGQRICVAFDIVHA